MLDILANACRLRIENEERIKERKDKKKEFILQNYAHSRRVVDQNLAHYFEAAHTVPPPNFIVPDKFVCGAIACIYDTFSLLEMAEKDAGGVTFDMIQGLLNKMYNFQKNNLLPPVKQAFKTLVVLQNTLNLRKSVPCFTADLGINDNTPLNHRLLRLFTHEHGDVYMKLFSKKIGLTNNLRYNEYVTHEFINVIDDIGLKNYGKCIKAEDGYYYGGFYTPTTNDCPEPDFVFHFDDDTGKLVKGQGTKKEVIMIASFAMKFVTRNTFYHAITDGRPYRSEIRLKLSNRTLKLIEYDAKKLEAVDWDIIQYRNTIRSLGKEVTTVAGARLPRDVVHKIAEMHLKHGRENTLMIKQTLDVIKDKKMTPSLMPHEFRYGSPSMSPFVAFIKAKMKYGELNTRQYEVKTPHGTYWPSRGRSPGGKGGVSYQWRKKVSKRKR